MGTIDTRLEKSTLHEKIGNNLKKFQELYSKDCVWERCNKKKALHRSNDEMLCVNVSAKPPPLRRRRQNAQN